MLTLGTASGVDSVAVVVDSSQPELHLRSRQPRRPGTILCVERQCQTAAAGSSLPSTSSSRSRISMATPVPGASVVWTTTGARLSRPPSRPPIRTGSSPRAAAAVRAGAVSVTATVAGTSISVTFTETGDSVGGRQAPSNVPPFHGTSRIRGRSPLRPRCARGWARSPAGRPPGTASAPAAILPQGTAAPDLPGEQPVNLRRDTGFNRSHTVQRSTAFFPRLRPGLAGHPGRRGLRQRLLEQQQRLDRRRTGRPDDRRW